jgi:hypothetical protein
MHESFARRIGECLEGRLPVQALLSGAVAPNRDSGWPHLHHGNRQVTAIITKAVRTARSEYLAGEPHRAAFQLGVASHYGLDNLVPRAEPAKEHAEMEARFDHADHNMAYPTEVPTEVADGRLAERSINQLVRVATVQPVNAEQRLAQAYPCLVRIAAAIAEEAEPAGVMEGLAEAFVAFNSRLEGLLARYRKAVQKAFAQQLRASGRKAEGLGAWRRRAVGLRELLRAGNARPAWHTALADALARRRFRSRLLTELDRTIGAWQDWRVLQQEFRRQARDYEESMRAVERRRGYWDWFPIRWHFWRDKGREALADALDELHEIRAKPVREEEARLRKASARKVLQGWNESGRARLARLCEGSLAAKAMVCAVPGLILLAVGAALGLTTAVPLAGALVIAGLLGLLTAPYVAWMLHNAQAVHRIASRAPEEGAQRTARGRAS